MTLNASTLCVHVYVQTLSFCIRVHVHMYVHILVSNYIIIPTTNCRVDKMLTERADSKLESIEFSLELYS